MVICVICVCGCIVFQFFAEIEKADAEDEVHTEVIEKTVYIDADGN